MSKKKHRVETEVAEPIQEPMIGIVSDCLRLNVRATTELNADVKCVLDVGSEVLIDEEASTEDYFKVCTATGIEGFCMRRYITPR